MRRFAGIETKYDEADQDRGTLRRADGILVAPVGCLSKGPSWSLLWSDDIRSRILAATAGQAGVNFVRIAKAGCTLLAAWDNSTGLPAGLWHVSGQLNGDSSGPASVTLETAGVGLAGGLPWYGAVLGDRLVLGNGVDTNLCFHAGTLRNFGPQFHDGFGTDDPAQHPFSPCKSFLLDTQGRVVCSGNATHPLRIWLSEAPNSDYPIVEGVRHERHFVDLLGTSATRITALQHVGGRIIAHTDTGACVLSIGYDPSTGFKATQAPLEAVGAPHHGACADGYFVGADLELYQAAPRVGRDAQVRDAAAITNRSSGDWNRQADAAAPAHWLLLDERSNRLWASMPLVYGNAGLYCYDAKGFAVTGPFLWPDLLFAARVRSSVVRGVPVVGFTRGGSILWADLSRVGIDSSLPGPAANIAVGVEASGRIVQRIGATDYLLGLTGWQVGESSADQWIPGGQAAVIDLCTEDFGAPTQPKDFLEVRLVAAPGSVFHWGVEWFDGRTTRRRFFPAAVTIGEARASIAASGLSLKLRIILVTTSSPCSISSVSLGFLAAPDG